MDRIRIALALLLVTLLALPASAATQLYFIHSDHLGTPRVVTDQNQTIVWKGHLKPFGQVEVEIEEISHRQRFPGQIADVEAGLYYNYFRDYDPRTGRYVQSDLIGLLGGQNTYAYAAGNPLRFFDLLGLAPGDSYNALDDAARDALNDILNKSILEDIEYAGRLYSKSDGTFSYTPPIPGTAHTSNPGGVPCDTNNEGYYHTHGAETDPGGADERFSPADKKFAKDEGTIGYLGTPSRKLKKYDPNGGLFGWGGKTSSLK